MSPSYLKIVSMSELYDTVFNVQTPLIDGLLQRGTYILQALQRWVKVL